MAPAVMCEAVGIRVKLKLGNLLRAILAASFFLPPAIAETHAHLHILVTVPAGSHGDVAYLVFASKDGFPNTKSKALRGGFVPVPDNAAHDVLIDAGELAPGRYAVTAYQDVNGNRKLDKNFLGVPQEPAGASNNPTPHMGPPGFDDCAFQFGNADQTISIVLKR